MLARKWRPVTWRLFRLRFLPHAGDVPYALADVGHLIVGQEGVEWQGDQVSVVVEAVRESGAVLAVGGEGGQGLVVDVGRHAALREAGYEGVAVRFVEAGDAHEVEVVRAVHRRRVVAEMPEAKFVAQLVVALDNLCAPGEHGGVAVELAKPDGGHDVRHVALVPGSDDVVFPGAELGLGEGVLALAVEREQLVGVVDFRVVDAGDGSPGRGAALGGGEVLDRVEREAGEVRDGAAVPSRTIENPRCPEGMCAVRHDGDATDGRLNSRGEVSQECPIRLRRNKQRPPTLHGLEEPAVVADAAAEVHGDDGLGARGDCRLQRIIIHLRHLCLFGAVPLDVHEDHLRAAVDGRRGGGGVGVGGDDHLVVGADAENAEVQLFGGGGGVEADHAVVPARGLFLRGNVVAAGFDIRGKPPFQQLGPWTGGDPAAAQGGGDLGNLQFGDVRRAKGNDTRHAQKFSQIDLESRQKNHDDMKSCLISSLGQQWGVLRPEA